MKTLNKFLFVLILVFSASIKGTGQSSYVFHHLDTRNGLSNSNVTAILKDSYGFLWIGTQSGLNRYDGYRFRVYPITVSQNNLLWTNYISGLREDGWGNIWINNAYGDILYKRDKDCFVNDIAGFIHGVGIQAERDYKTYIDKNRDLWVFTREEAFHYNIGKEELKEYALNFHIDGPATIKPDDDGKFLYGFLGHDSLWQIEMNTGKQSAFTLPGFIKELIPYNKIYIDCQGYIWLYSTRDNVIYFSQHLETQWKKLVLNFPVNTPNNVVLDIQDDKKGHIWIGTDHGGLYIYNRASGTLFNLLHHNEVNSTIASNNIACLFLDDNETMWMGHNKKGVSFYHDSFNNFINVENSNIKDVSIMLEDKKGNIWFGTDGNGLYRSYDIKAGKSHKLPISGNTVVSLLEDRKGRVWIGTYINGLFCCDKDKYTHYTHENSMLASNDIWDLAEDRYGNLWIAALGAGIQRLHSDGEKPDSFSTVSKDMQSPLDMYYDGGDKLYIGTAYGLGVIDITTDNQSIFLGNKQKTQEFRQAAVTNVFKDTYGNIWMGHLQGLTIWDTKKDTLYFFDKEDGLCDNIVQSIFEDNNHNIWVTTSNGVSILNTGHDDRDVMTITSRNLSVKDGLSDNCFNHNAFCKLNNGDILLGYPEGYTIVNPNKNTEKKQPRPKVLFTNLSVGGTGIQVGQLYNGHVLLKHPLEQTGSLTFRHNDKLISLQFASGDLLNADKSKYAYKLTGFNEQWVQTRENKIEFSSLGPGDYKLFIKACNSDGVWNEKATVMHIIVTPPFYLSNWAIMVYIFLFVGLILFIIYRTRKHHRAKLEKQKLQFEQKQEATLNEMKLRFFTNISHDLRTPLTLILTPLQTILSGVLEDGLRKKLNTINKNAEQLLQLINSLLDFRKLDIGAETLHLQPGDFVNFIKELCLPFYAYAIERNINFSFLNGVDMQPMQFDSEKVQKMALNLLSNAFKYTPSGGSIDVHVYQEDDCMCFSVSDSGPGINEADKKHLFERFFQASQKQEKTGSGIGLHIVSEYVRIHKGIVTVSDNKPQGSIFTVKLPIQNINIEEDDDIPENQLDDELSEQIEKNQNVSAKPVLLFVDDNIDLCEFLADSLSDEYTVLLSHNGQEALSQIEKNNVNIVVSDVMMPLMSGTELCNQIKTNIKWSHIPVILLTARTAEEHQIAGLELGADDYLTKPFNFNLLRLRIRKFIEWTEKCHLSFSQKMDVSPSEITITPLDEQLIEKAIKVVEERINDIEFSVEDLSVAVGLSRSYLYKKLMNITGKGPAEFIRTIRLKRGRQLLEKSQLQIAEVAYTVGFNSPKRFSINFKNEFGITPSEYLRCQK